MRDDRVNEGEVGLSSLHKIPQSYAAYTETKLEELVTSALHRDIDSCSKMVWKDDKTKMF